MNSLSKNKLLKGLISFFILCIFISFFSIIIKFPKEINIIQGEDLKFLSNIVLKLDFEDGNNNIEMKSKKMLSPYAFLNVKNTGSIKGKINLFGLFPMKNFVLNIIPNILVIPSGESIGVKIEPRGIMVVGLSFVIDDHGKKTSPASESGFSIGDRILKINGKNVETEDDIIKMINSRSIKGKQCKVSVKRGNYEIDLSIKPVKSVEDNLYKMGIWVRNNVAGVGTMTFYEQTSGEFAALGHGITDIDTGVLIDIDKGKILKSKIIGIEKAKKSLPGEMIGSFNEKDGAYGSIEKNTTFGIYGILEKDKIPPKGNPIPIGLAIHVKEGNAKILTTIKNDKVEEFEIEIQKVFKQNNADSKSMIIKITDPRLIKETGGIVQGMSGSPIIQNGKLIGCITHVLINEPMKGYAVFAEWMLKETRIDSSIEYKNVVNQ